MLETPLNMRLIFKDVNCNNKVLDVKYNCYMFMLEIVWRCNMEDTQLEQS